MKHYNITISGKVQGVFYRAGTREKAKSLGLVGFVKNREDGTVYIEVEGNTDLLDQLVDWCREGTSAARVEKVDFDESELVGFDRFEISRR